MFNQTNDLDVARNNWENGQYQQAIAIYDPWAKSGNAEAQYMLALGYECGLGVVYHPEEAIKWYQQSAMQGYQWAQNNLGNCYYNGFGVMQDYRKAAEWYFASSKQGNAEAQNSLGVLYEMGRGLIQDYSKAVQWYEKSANQGHETAQNTLGDYYQYGTGVLQNYSMAAFWYEKSANQGNAIAQNNIGYFYQEGLGVTQDFKTAIYWYELSAAQDNMYAQNNLGHCYQWGVGVEQNLVHAIEWYEKSVNQGNETAKNNLDVCREEITNQGKSNVWEEEIVAQSHVQSEKEKNEENSSIFKPIQQRSNNEKSEYADITIEESFAKLNRLIGLTEVKEQVEKLYNKVQYNNKRNEVLGIENREDTSYHFVFSGNPGTGKTTVARLFGELFYQMGILQKGHLVETDRSELVGQFVGQTAKDTKGKVDKAMDGVLFIDEAYSLHSNDESDFGKEAINTLVKEIEDHRSNFIVILAGYRDEMEELMKSNPGLQSRFTKFIEFQDYTEEELLEIAIMIAKDQHYEISEDGQRAFRQTIRRLMVNNKFGNARAVRNVMNEAFEEKANNFNMDSDYDFTLLTASEFSLSGGNEEHNMREYLAELHSLIGLDSVKNDITHLIERMEYEQKEEERTGRKNTSMDMHMVFTGNPGTGKTTIARLYGDLLRGIGILKKGHFKEVSRANLVGKYQGHTAQKVKEACEDAYGGILFIDEAYSLCTGEYDSFGKEAVDTLIKEMEDNKDKLLVILAGYTSEMDEFLSTNPGFASRISKTVVFPDYSALELFEIFQLYMKKEQIIMEECCTPVLNERFTSMVTNSTENFGNARDARKLFNDIKRNMISRVQREEIEGDDRRKITLGDLQIP